jgi:hypothetical protein
VFFLAITMISVTPFTILLLSFILPRVTAVNVMRYLFNNGIISEELSCNSTEWEKIDPIFDSVKPNNRALRQVNVSSKKRETDFEVDVIGEEGNDEKKRELLTNAQCKNLCAGQTPGTYCRATGCTWYIVRRKLGNWCFDTAGSINAQLDNLVSKKLVSSSCQNLLSAPRKIECLDDIVFGEVEQFNVWDADKDKILQKDAINGYSICALTQINIEVITNPCVKFTLLELKGPNGFYMSNRLGALPYTIFGNPGKDMYGRSLAPGEYRISATPDDQGSKKKELRFLVTQC